MACRERVKALQRRDRAAGRGAVALPDAMARKMPSAVFHFRWQWLFPATRGYCDPVSGRMVRHHIHETVIQEAVARAAQAAEAEAAPGGVPTPPDAQGSTRARPTGPAHLTRPRLIDGVLHKAVWRRDLRC